MRCRRWCRAHACSACSVEASAEGGQQFGLISEYGRSEGSQRGRLWCDAGLGRAGPCRRTPAAGVLGDVGDPQRRRPAQHRWHRHAVRQYAGDGAGGGVDHHGPQPPLTAPPPISNGGHSHFLHTLCTFVYRIYNVMSISTSIDWCSHTPCHSAWLAESDPFPHPAEGVRRANVSYVDQVTAQPLALLSSQKAPSSSFARPRPY